MHLYHESRILHSMNTSLHWDKWSDIIDDNTYIVNYLDVPEDEIMSMTHRANKKFKKDHKKGTKTDLQNKNIILVYEFEVMHTLVWTAVSDYLHNEGWKNILIIDGGFELRITDKFNMHFAQSPFFYYAFAEKPYKEFEEAIAEKDTLFSSLARRARYSRVRITVDLIERGLDKKGYVSCGWCGHEEFFTHPHFKQNMLWYKLIPEHLHDRFPVTLNHPDEDQWEVEGRGLDRVCLNVVQETHVGWMYQEKYRTQTRSDRAHFTEKSTKPFWYYQIPLVFGTPFQVELLKNQGFDMFDDIFDLSYDNEIDVIKREKMLVDQIEKFCAKPISYWQDYMLENKSRFFHNRKNLLTNYQILRDTLKSKISNLDSFS